MATAGLNNPPSLGPVSLRISVTDLCQYRCLYCTPPEGVQLFPHWRILRYEEMLAFVRIINKHLGLSKVHLTGGEPLVRADILDFVGMLAQEGIEDLALTTNGKLLAELASRLHRAGLTRITVSLDSLNAETYRQITRGGDLQAALDGIEAAGRAGLAPLKLNTTVLRGINDSEITALAGFAVERGLTLRFIELMPLGYVAENFQRWFFSSQEVLETLEQEFEVQTLPRGASSSSREYSIKDSAGRSGTIGVISSTSQPFCGDCNRLRLTATGDLIGCLAKGRADSILSLLRTEGSIDEAQILRSVQTAMRHKRKGTDFSSDRNMVKVGG